MGAPSAEQTVMIIEAVGDVVSTQPPPPPPAAEWWQIAAILAGAAATLLTAWAGYIAVKRKGKK